MKNLNNFSITFQNKTHNWQISTVNEKLEKIGNLKGKKTAWIQGDLGLKKSNALTRAIWSLVAKYFSWMRKHLYGVDLKKSRSFLEQIGKDIRPDSPLKKVYQKAVNKFNEIAPRNHLEPNLPFMNAHPHFTLKGQGYKSDDILLDFVKQHGKDVKTLNLKRVKNIENSFEKIISYCPNLTFLMPDGDCINDEKVSLIAKTLPFLHELDFRDTYSQNFSSIKPLRTLENLKKLTLSRCNDNILKELKELKNLEVLRIEWSDEITASGLENLKELPNLKELYLHLQNKKEEVSELGFIKNLSNLKILWIIDCGKITDASIENLSGLSNLTELLVRGSEKVTDKGLRHLKDLKNLKILDLYLSKNITYQGLAHLKNLHHLKTLKLSNLTNITDDGLETLLCFNNLKVNLC